MPRKKDSEPYRSVICSILLDDVSKASGATRFVPESHKLLGLPDDYGYGSESKHPNEKYFTGAKGSIIVYSGHLWHGGTKSRNGKPRKQLFINYRTKCMAVS